jgi:hypothetical protein
MDGPNRLLRSELAKFLPSQRAIRAFEQLFDIVPSEINSNSTLIEETSINAQNADSRAQQAVSAIARLADAVELLALAPPSTSATTDFDIAPPVMQFNVQSDVAPPITIYNSQSDIIPPVINEVRRKRYGAFYSTITQTAAAVNTAYPMTLNTTDPFSFGVYIGTPTSRVYVDTEGLYNFQFSAQLAKTTGGVGAFFIWPRVNNVDIANSATKIRIQGNNAECVAAWNFVLAVNAGDYFELMWSTDDLNCQIFASAASSPVPAIPSVILTVTDNIS